MFTFWLPLMDLGRKERFRKNVAKRRIFYPSLGSREEKVYVFPTNFVAVNVFHTEQRAPMRARYKGRERKPRAPEAQKGLSPKKLIALAQNQREDTFSLLLRLPVENATPLM